MEIKLSLLLFVSIIVSNCHGNDQFEVLNTDGQEMKYISAGPNYYWALSTSGQIFRCDNPCTSWTKLDGQLKSLDVGEDEIWGANSGNAIFKRPADGSGQWTTITGKLKQVSASGNGYIWGVNSEDKIFKCKKPCGNGGQGWIVVEGRLKQVDGGDKYVYGVNSINEVFARSIDGSGSWRKIPGRMKHVTASGHGYIFGVTESGQTYRCSKPCVGEWERMEGKMSQVDATFNALLAIGADSRVYYHKINNA